MAIHTGVCELATGLAGISTVTGLAGSRVQPCGFGCESVGWVVVGGGMSHTPHSYGWTS